MSLHTLIQWCDSTVNPTMGCDGCELWNKANKSCYAGNLTEKWKGKKGYPDAFLVPKVFPGRMLEAAKWSDLAGQPRPEKPWLDDLPRIIFISDMGDSLSEAITDDYLKTELIQKVAGFSGHEKLWIWLTKRPRRMAQFCETLRNQNILWPDNLIAATSIIAANNAASRLGSLKKVAARYRALSVEPLWEPVRLDLIGIDLVIVGGESEQRKGESARPFDLDWARSLRDQCSEAGDGVLFQTGRK